MIKSTWYWFEKIRVFNMLLKVCDKKKIIIKKKSFPNNFSLIIHQLIKSFSLLKKQYIRQD